MNGIVSHLRPPYYAVIFTSLPTGKDADGYGATAERMLRLAEQQPGFLGVETVRDPAGLGITVSYWKDLQSIRHWKHNPEHQQAQAAGKTVWYEQYQLRICKVEAEYGGPEPTALA